MKTYIYEVVGATCEGQYFTMGLFLDEDEAVALLTQDEPPYGDDDPAAVSIEVRRRPLGFHPHAWAAVASRTWVRNYDDTKPDWLPKTLKRFPL